MQSRRSAALIKNTCVTIRVTLFCQVVLSRLVSECECLDLFRFFNGEFWALEALWRQANSEWSCFFYKLQVFLKFSSWEMLALSDALIYLCLSDVTPSRSKSFVIHFVYMCYFSLLFSANRIFFKTFVFLFFADEFPLCCYFCISVYIVLFCCQGWSKANQ